MCDCVLVYMERQCACVHGKTVRHRLRYVTVCMEGQRDSEAQIEVCDCALVCMERQTVRHRLRCVTVCLCPWKERQ